MSETDVADALTELSGTVGGLHDENKCVTIKTTFREYVQLEI